MPAKKFTLRIEGIPVVGGFPRSL